MLPDAVAEQELTARRGREKTQLRLRVFAPTPWEGNFRCKLELTADGRTLFPHRPDAPGIAGVDSLQAFVLALRFAAHELLRFELGHGMKIEPWEWSSLIALIADVPVDPYMRERITEIQKALRAPQESAIGDLRTASASRKPSAASRKPRASRPAVRAERKRR